MEKLYDVHAYPGEYIHGIRASIDFCVAATSTADAIETVRRLYMRHGNKPFPWTSMKEVTVHLSPCDRGRQEDAAVIEAGHGELLNSIA